MTITNVGFNPTFSVVDRITTTRKGLSMASMPLSNFARLEKAVNAARSRRNLDAAIELIVDLDEVKETTVELYDALEKFKDHYDSAQSEFEDYENSLDDRDVSADERAEKWDESCGYLAEMIEALNEISGHIGTLREQLPEIFPAPSQE